MAERRKVVAPANSPLKTALDILLGQGKEPASTEESVAAAQKIVRDAERKAGKVEAAAGFFGSPAAAPAAPQPRKPLPFNPQTNPEPPPAGPSAREIARVVQLHTTSSLDIPAATRRMADMAMMHQDYAWAYYLKDGVTAIASLIELLDGLLNKPDSEVAPIEERAQALVAEWRAMNWDIRP